MTGSHHSGRPAFPNPSAARIYRCGRTSLDQSLPTPLNVHVTQLVVAVKNLQHHFAERA